MTYKVYERTGKVEDVVKTADTKGDCTAFVKQRQDEHLRMARQYCSPLGMRKVRRYVREKFRIEKVQETVQ